MVKIPDEVKGLEPRICHTCNGKGKYKKYIPMPSGTLQKVEVECQMCEGKGIVDLIDNINPNTKYRV